MLKILKPSVRITEMADTAKQLVMLYKSEAGLANDPILKPVFTQVEALAEELSQAIKSDKILSEVDKADDVRDDLVRQLDKYLKSYANIPVESLRKSGERLYAVFSKYGVGITRESYSVESAHIESLLKDLAEASLQADISALEGIAPTIESLKTAQADFDQKRLTYEKNMAAQSKRPKSAHLKKLLLKQINVGLIPYLTSATFVSPETFTHFADTIAQIINTINSNIIGRSKKSNNNNTSAQ
ncbi:hypothetical protein CAPN001_11840 [Capnocytophaga stomatis]|uniref:DUF6261 family protein n=1 Tax=Capnocytophaga stomatis TaxID=1848904 RepID=UPI001A4DC343|nr:DUF6261 family protein [Capnocytophaga stomatis]GIJ96615.1 hypothetical protein CAPN001_11840 [Capnocytophaga stomatis]